MELAFEEWKRIFNLSLTANYIVILCLVIHTIESSDSYSVYLMRWTIGILLIGLNTWSSLSTFDVIGEKGWYIYILFAFPTTL